MGTFHKAIEVNELTPGSCKGVEVSGQQIALFNIGGTFYAIGDTCTHMGGNLADGTLDGTTVTCPLHSAEFDVTTGRNLTPPAVPPTNAVPVEVIELTSSSVHHRFHDFNSAQNPDFRPGDPSGTRPRESRSTATD